MQVSAKAIACNPQVQENSFCTEQNSITTDHKSFMFFCCIFDCVEINTGIQLGNNLLFDTRLLIILFYILCYCLWHSHTGYTANVERFYKKFQQHSCIYYMVVITHAS